MAARIVQLARSDGGVPKQAVTEATVGERGMAGDRQAHPKIHGGPERALCLFSLEVIEKLQGEGHPIEPGSTGENVTISGLPWAALAPRMQLALGDEVLVELTRTASPCSQIAGSFADRKFKRLEAPGEMRWYCRVLRGGTLRTGMAVQIVDSAHVE
jgi:MOSC domain-containing protein YiiM